MSVLLLAVSLGAACTDGVAPTETSGELGPSAPAFEHSVFRDTVVTIYRDIPLQRDLWTFRVIGRDGGEIMLEEAGLKVIVPPGAVWKPTKITVRAHAGKGVVYSFGPHGLRFREPLRIEQALQNTSGFQRDITLVGGYFADDSALRADGTAEITEILPTEWVQTGNKVKFYVHHFSGYLLGIP